MKEKLIVILTTTETKKEAENIAAYMIEKRLCACAQVSGPIKSWYWWENKVESSEEWQVKLKTLHKNYQKVEEALKSIHPYDLPQIIGLPVIEAYNQYAKWVIDNLDTDAGDK